MHQDGKDHGIFSGPREDNGHLVALPLLSVAQGTSQ